MIDTTMIRLITGATTHLGDSAKDAFLVWVILDKILPFVIGLIAIILIFILIKKLIASMSHEAILCKWRDDLWVGSPGHLDSREKALLIRRIDELIANSKKEK